MTKPDKKKVKLQARIDQLEGELRLALQKKAAGPAISVPKYMQEIQTLKAQLAAMG